MFKNPFSFKGRIRRTEFAISYVIWFCSIPILSIMIGQSQLDSLFIWMMIVMIGAANWLIIAQSAKRCHDMGNSGFYQFIPFYVFALFFAEGWESYLIEITLIMTGYYLILHFNFKNEWEPILSRYFILHRAIFSVTLYVLITIYKTYGYNLQDMSFLNIGFIVNSTSVFLLTYIPYLIFKAKKSSKPFLLET